MHKIRTLRLVAIMVASLLGVANMSAQPFGLWNFDSGNLTATVGTALAYADGGGLTAAATAFGTTTSFGIPDINGTPAAVMKFPAATNGMGYNMLTPPANGGGSYVNQYTYILDVLYPTASGTSIRPLIRPDDGLVDATEQYIVADTTGAVGPASPSPGGITGPFVGKLLANTWYRLGLVVNATGTIRVYTNGVEMGSFAGDILDGFYSMTASGSALILGTSETNAAVGYVNSIQLRTNLLNAGQMSALGGPDAAGIPAIIPPVPSFIVSRNPDLNATGIAPLPAVTVVLDQGDTVINSSSIQLSLDGANLATSVTPTSPTFTATASVATTLDPSSIHTLKVVWQDSVVGNKTNSWSFTVTPYQILTLPAPFYIQNFDGVAETAFPVGWYSTNNTETDTPGFDLTDPTSDSYKGWVVITTNTLFTAKGGGPLIVPWIMVNGAFLPSMANDKLCYAESDSRGGSQVQMLFATNINCTGRANVFLSFHSIRKQNQDDIASVEYSVDGGVTWLPGLYMLDDQDQAADVIRTNGVIDVGATYLTARGDQAYGSNYGTYIGAPVSTALIPATSGRINDDSVESIRVEVIRLLQADNKPNVSLRFMQAGTASWWFGIDEVGLYEITTPVFSTPPANLTVAGGTSGSFTVVVASPTPVTYQWQHAGTNISNGGHYSGVNTATLTVSNAGTNDAGAYRCKATNASGPTTSSQATLTVILVPIMTTQPTSVVVSDGYPAAFSGVGFGAPPLTYEWRLGSTPVGSGTSYSLPSAHTANAGDYTLVVNNSYGAVTSQVARLSVVNVPVTSDLVVHLKFDSDYNDSSGRGNNGTVIGSPSLIAGKIGNAMQYTDADGGASYNYVTLDNPVGTHPADLRMGTSTSFSISFWYKVPSGNRQGDPALVSNKDWDSGGNTGFVIFNSGGGLQWNYTEVNDGVNANSRKDSGGNPPGLEDGNWHHCLVAFQRGGGGFSYVDGNLVKYFGLATPNPAGGSFASTTIDNDPSNPRTRTATGAWNIGEDGSGLYTSVGGGHDGPGISVTNAMIDDLGVWRRAVSAQEALAIYNAGNAGQDLSLVAAPSSLGNLSITYSGGLVSFSWVGGTGIRLQKSTSLTTPVWVDVPGTLGVSSYIDGITAAQNYYRLHKP